MQEGVDVCRRSSVVKCADAIETIMVHYILIAKSVHMTTKVMFCS